MEIAELIARLPTDWSALLVYLADRPWLRLGDGLDGPARALLADLYLHRDRQRWVADIVQDALGGDLDRIGAEGAFAHPEHRQECGPVPGHPGWRYLFHGKGCALEHDDGTCLDVDFDEGGADRIDPYFYAGYLQSVSERNLAQQVICRPAPFDEAWMADLPPLIAAGLIDEAHAFSLTAEGLAHGRTLATLVTAPGQGLRAIAAGALLGWFEPPAVLPAAQREAIIDAFGACARTQHEQRCTRLSEAYCHPRDRSERRHALLAIAAEDLQHAAPLMRELLRGGPLDGTVSTALDIVEADGIAPWEEELLQVLRRARGKAIPEPHIRATAARLLLSYWRPESVPADRVRALRKTLRRAAGAEDAVAARLLYLLDREAGLKRLRRALADEIPANRTEAAVSLCLLAPGDAEARQILAAADTPEAACARAIAAGLPVAAAEPVGEVVTHRGRQVKVYSMDEIMAANLPDWIRSALQQAIERFGPLLRRWRG